MNDVEICNTTKNELKSFAVVVVMMLQFTGPNKKQKDKTEAVPCRNLISSLQTPGVSP